MRIAHFGTFDVNNYGDLLFPKILEWRLKSVEIQHISPTSNQTMFSDAVGAVDTINGKVDAVLIGGGNIVNFRATPLDTYSSVASKAYPKLVIEPALIASHSGVPLMINSPSISANKHNVIELFLLSRVLANTSYIALRDPKSVELAKQLTNSDVHFVPDTAFDIARMWPVECAIGRKKSDYIIVHLNKRYGGSPQETAGALDRISGDVKSRIVMMPIGPCHGDIEYMHQVAAHMRSKVEFQDVLTLQEFAQKIACARMYVGSSMHGFITAVSYDTPCALILGNTVNHKFHGVLDVCGLSHDVIFESWVDFVESGCPAPRVQNSHRREIFARLDSHWEKVFLALSTVPQAKKPVGLPIPMILARISQYAIHMNHLVRKTLKALIFGAVTEK